jgi:hypothetical protein
MRVNENEIYIVFSDKINALADDTSNIIILDNAVWGMRNELMRVWLLLFE